MRIIAIIISAVFIIIGIGIASIFKGIDKRLGGGE